MNAAGTHDPASPAATGSAAVDLVVPDDARGLRLDAYLAKALPDRSRSRLKALIDDGRVTLDGESARGSVKLRGGERVRVVEPPPVPTELVAEDLPLSIVYEDEDLLVLEKPAGIVVHPGAGHAAGTLANALLFHVPGISVGGELRPGIVHRLDKDTSGLLVVAKNERAHRKLGESFRARDVTKAYVAFCLGRPKQDRFELVTGHKRHDVDRRRFTTKLPPPSAEEQAARPGVRRACSRVAVVASAAGVSELEVDLVTGRTHQIRAHLADIGHPLVHDPLYGGGSPEKRTAPGPVRDAVVKLRRHALHARDLSFPHPTTGARLAFRAPLPPDLARLHDAVQRVAGSA